MTIQDKDLLLVGVPKESGNHLIHYEDGSAWLEYYSPCPKNATSAQKDFWGKKEWYYEIELPPGQWEPVGLYPGLTEEQAKLCVCKPVLYLSALYTDYTGKAEFFYTALESLASRIEALGAYIKNPFGNYTKKELDEYWVSHCEACGWRGLSRDCAGGEAIADTGDYSDPCCPKCFGPESDDDEWSEAQSRTSGQWLVLMKK